MSYNLVIVAIPSADPLSLVARVFEQSNLCQCIAKTLRGSFFVDIDAFQEVLFLDMDVNSIMVQAKDQERVFD